MKCIIYNTGYFIREAKTIFKLNLLSNVFSLLSTGLIFFILAMVASSWWVSGQIAKAIQGEAEINVYFDGSMENTGVVKLVEDIKGIQSVREVRLVGEDEAYGRMEEILGKEASVLKYFEDNPFSSFIEVKIQLGQMEQILEKLNRMDGIEYIRDNREILERIRSLSEVLDFLGYLVLFAVGISTLVIISHIIRLGVYNNREQIETLRLLGAPETFIALPFLLTGLVLTLGGGMIASALASFAIKTVYTHVAGPLPFIPLPSRETLTWGVAALVISLSAVLGLAGSFFGLSPGKGKGA